MSSRPAVWARITAAEGFAQISTAGKKVKTKDCSPCGKYPVIDQGQEKVAGYIDDPEKLISVIEPLIIFGDHTRAVKWVDFSFVPGADGTKILQTKPYLLPRFAYQQLRSLEIPNKGYSRHFKFLKELKFEVPPLAEQKVIADNLDTLLAQVENTKARLERIPQILKRFRQSVLAEAVSGRLTKNWTSQLRSINEVCSKSFDGPFGSKLKSSDYTEHGVRVCRLENIGHLKFDNTKATYISEEKYSTLKKNKVETGDVLFSSFVDEEVKVCVFKIANELFINKADCFCLRPNSKMVSSEYLSYVLASRSSYNQIKNQVQGVTRPRINLRILKGLSFEFPPLEQQREIVARVEELFTFSHAIEQKTIAALERINKLTQSILAKAFRGEFTTDWRAANQDLLTGQNSAKALLEKIKKERQKLKPTRKTRTQS